MACYKCSPFPCKEQNDVAKINREFGGFQLDDNVKYVLDFCFCFFSAPRCRCCQHLYDQPLFPTGNDNDSGEMQQAAEKGAEAGDYCSTLEGIAGAAAGPDEFEEGGRLKDWTKCKKCFKALRCCGVFDSGGAIDIAKRFPYLAKMFPYLGVLFGFILGPIKIITGFRRRDKNQVLKGFLGVLATGFLLITILDFLFGNELIAWGLGVMLDPCLDWFVYGRCDECCTGQKSGDQTAADKATTCVEASPPPPELMEYNSENRDAFADKPTASDEVSAAPSSLVKEGGTLERV